MEPPPVPGVGLSPELRPCGVLLEQVEAEHRAVAAGQARRARALAAWVGVLSEPEAAPAGDGAALAAWHQAQAAGAIGTVADEAGPALGLTPGTALRLVETSVRLVHALPATLAALEAGVLDWRRATMITSATAHLGPDVAGIVDDTLCGPGGTGLDVVGGELTKAIDSAIHDADADALAVRSRHRTGERGMRTRATGDGQGELCLNGPAPAIADIAAAIDALGQESLAATRAGHGNGDPYAIAGIDSEDSRGIDAHRFDALHDHLTQQPTANHDQHDQPDPAPTSDRAPASASTSARTRTRATVMIALSTLLGADDNPGHLDGYGLLPAWLARAAARNARLRRVLTDPFTGAVIGIDSHTYPPHWLTPTDPPTSDAPGHEDPGHEDPDEGSGDQGPGPDGRGPGHGPTSGPSHGPNSSSAGPGDTAPGDTGPGQNPPGGEHSAHIVPAATDTSADSRTPVQPCTPVDPGDCPVTAAGGGPYRVPAALARLVRAHWGSCTVPGCHRPATTCDLDHTTPHPAGPTCGCNLHPLCRGHHLMKHATPDPTDRRLRADWARTTTTPPARWDTYRCTLGHQHWTSPLNRTYTTRPPAPLGPPTTTATTRTPTPPLNYLTTPTATTPPATTTPTATTTTPVHVAHTTLRGYDHLDPHHPDF